MNTCSRLGKLRVRDPCQLIPEGDLTNPHAPIRKYPYKMKKRVVRSNSQKTLNNRERLKQPSVQRTRIAIPIYLT